MESHSRLDSTMNRRQRLELEAVALIRITFAICSIVSYLKMLEFPSLKPSVPSFAYYHDELWMNISSVSLFAVWLLAYGSRFSSINFLQPMKLYAFIDLIASWVWAIWCMLHKITFIPFIGEYNYVFILICFVNILFKFFHLSLIMNVPITVQYLENTWMII